MGFTLIIQTFLIVILSGILTKTFWFSYSLFLIFLGGILILFIYITSIASNEQFKFKINLYTFFIINLLIIIILLFFYFLNIKTFFFNKIFNLDNLYIIKFKTLTFENRFILNKIYNFPINIITIILINYLFLTLIASVKITNIFEGPLRSKN